MRDDIQNSMRDKLIAQLADRHSKKEIEEFFGIVIKEVDKKAYLYNVYKDEKLLIPKITCWDIGIIFHQVADGYSKRVCEEADKEKDLKETDREYAKMQARQSEYEKNNYHTCPVCGECTPIGEIHIHPGW